MLSKSQLEMLAPYGYRTFFIECVDCGEFWRTLLEFQHKADERLPFRLTLDLPKVNGPHLIMDGVERTVIPAVTECGLRSRTETLRNMLNAALERALCDHVHHGGPPPNAEVVMAEFRALIAKSPFVCDTPPHSPLERSGYEQMVRIDRHEGNVIKTDWREFQDEDWGKFDPNSTAQGEKINRVYRVARDENSLCSSIGDNVVFARANPRRVFLTRTAFERHLPQLVPEEPLVSNVRSRLSGKTLLTAFMDLGNTTFEDSIAVSRSAAAAMTCVREVNQSWVGHQKLKVEVPVGSYVQPKCLLATVEEGVESVHADKLNYPAKLVDVKVVPTLKFRRPGWRYTFVFRAELPLRDGDKIAGRHGNKGVVWIVDDKDMPMVPNPDNPDMSLRVDVCISPISVVKRRMMSIFLEGMAAKKALAEDITVELDGWEIPDELSFKQLVKEGWGQKSQLILGGMPLPEKTFVAPLLWLRLDKLAIEQVSCSRGRVVVNHLGLPIDSARINGQKRDVSKSLAFFHRGLRDLLEDSVRRNTIGVRKCENVIQILEPGFRLDQLSLSNQ